ncbi:hypothetical protein AJ79_01011 [Helicocarpus griseus UAMH5409]|uniref:Arrestin C-terminal-like domain-containing protein n=1 Tax=Helicocarpus griseus UAMH5409 TaxID=1447875 RepID=A0A2B7Y982_9EURO|nr:hypothetical protein AJ79_01011 [Helicocarpus griseus UAMH5409]
MLLNRATPAGNTAESVDSISPTRRSSRSRPTSLVDSCNIPIQDAPPPPLSILRNEQIVATSNGITVSICLAEPVLFLEGFERNDLDARKTSILRGTLRLRLSKSAKIKKVSLNFKGLGQTNWPEGLSHKKSQLHEQHTIMNHTWMLFNAQLPAAEHSHGADHMRLKTPAVTTKELATSTIEALAKSGSSTSLASMPKEAKRLSLNSSYSRSFGKGETSHGGPSVASRGYKLFPPGEYCYNFELPISSRYSESINSIAGWVKYTLTASVERAGAFRPNLLGHREVPFIRAPAEGSLEHVEPIAISRTWEDQLHYDIIISGKSFPLGGQVPIAFKLTPLAKVTCHRIKVFVTENMQVVANNKIDRRLDGNKKVLLFEKRAECQSQSAFPGSVCRVTAGGGVAYDARRAAAEGIEYVNPRNNNLLGDLETDFEAGPTEMEFNVQLPTCEEMKKKDNSRSLHFDTTHESLQINHWIKIVLRLSRPDGDDLSKRRHFEISIDSPFHIMSCLAAQSNLYLPAYSSPSQPLQPSRNLYCGCKIAKEDADADTPPATATSDPSITRSLTDSSGSLALPAQAHMPTTSSPTPFSPPLHPITNNDDTPGHLTRPLHLLRTPSFAPPSFEDLPPPPPLPTPPPDYTSIVPAEAHEPGAGLDDYFERLHVAEREFEEGMRGRSRVDVPLTPGGRVNRSMELPREWVRAGEGGGGDLRLRREVEGGREMVREREREGVERVEVEVRDSSGEIEREEGER